MEATPDDPSEAWNVSPDPSSHTAEGNGEEEVGRESPRCTMSDIEDGSGERYKLEIRKNSRSPSDKADRTQTQMQELAKAMVQLKEFVTQSLRPLGNGEGKKVDGVSCLDSTTLARSTSSRMNTASIHRGESEPPKKPLRTPIKEGPSTSADTQRKTPVTEDLWTKGMQKIIASIEKPKTALPTFTGDSRKEYSLFMRRFHRYLRDHAVDASSKLDMLIDACTGRTKDLLMRYVRMGPEEGYSEPLKMLASRLGDTEDHIDELLIDLLTGPSVPDNDMRQIKEFTDKIWDIIADLEYTGRHADVETYVCVAMIARRLTGNLRQRYKNQLHKYKKKRESKSRPDLKWFRDFMEDYMERLLGEDDSGDENSSKLKQDTKGKRTADTPKRKAMGFAVAERGSASGSQGASGKSGHPCFLCEKKHPLFACWKFRAMSIAERWEATRKAQVCYVCLGHGHMASKCGSPYKECGLEGCSQQHSRWLHKDDKQNNREAKRSVSLSSPETPDKRIRVDETDD